MSLTNTIGIRIDEETTNKLRALAVKKRRKTSDLVRIIIENYVEQFGEEE